MLYSMFCSVYCICLLLCYIVPRQDVHVFAEEKDSDGKRSYVVATLEEFWSKYRLDASQYWEQLQTLRIMVKRERERDDAVEWFLAMDGHNYKHSGTHCMATLLLWPPSGHKNLATLTKWLDWREVRWEKLGVWLDRSGNKWL